MPKPSMRRSKCAGNWNLTPFLSPGTEAYDRGAKSQRYRKIPSLAEYALVDIERRRVDLFRKLPDGL